MTKTIELTQGKVALVDDADYEWLSRWKWYAWRSWNGSFYARRGYRESGKTRTVWMHREILGVTDKKIEVDHINGNGLDNRRQNIRTATHAQNLKNQKKPSTNTSGFKGVDFHKPKKKYRARVCTDSKKKLIGYFDDPVEAAHAYDREACKEHGEFAKTNFGDCPQ